MEIARRLTAVSLRMRSIWRRHDVERELDDELTYHLERLTLLHQSEGMAPAAARAAAMKTLGGLAHAKDGCRDARRLGLLEDFVQDLRIAVRAMRRRAGTTLVALLTLAIGIGSTTAVVSVVNALWLKPAYRDADRIVWVFETSPKGQGSAVSSFSYLHWLPQVRSFDALAAWGFTAVTLDGDVPLPLRAVYVTANYFDVFGLRAARGRVLLPTDEQAGHDHVVVLSHELWVGPFGGDPDIIGRSIRVRGELYSVVGVLPPRATDGEWSWTQLWLPRTFDAQALTNPYRSFNVFGKLRAGVPLRDAQREMSAIAAALARESPETNRDWGVSVANYTDMLIGPELQRSLWVLLGAVLAVLLIACVNLASVRLVTALAQERESAIRTALGGGRMRLVRQYATESVLLAVCGSLLGVLLAYALLAAMQSMLPEFSSANSGVPPRGLIALDGRMLAFATLLSVGTSLACGLVPALVTLRTNLVDSMKDRRSSVGTSRGRWRRVFLVVELALAFVLVISSGELLMSVRRLQTRPLGFQSADVLTAAIPLSLERNNGDPAARTRYLESLLDAVQRTPGVSSAALTSVLPLQGWGTELPFQRSDRPLVPVPERATSFFKMVTPDYFVSLQLAMRRGRTLTPQDRAGTPRVAVINETMARMYFGQDDPVGRVLLMPELVMAGTTRNGTDVPWEIVGVVADERVTGLKDTRLSPGVYVPLAQSPTRRPALVARLKTGPGAELAVRRAVAGVSRDQALADVKWLDALKNDSLGSDRQRSLVLTSFALCAVLLSAIGIYGLMSHLVALRTHELGVRAAIGARASELARLVVLDGLLLAGTGVAVGVVAWLGTSRILQTLLTDLVAVDAFTVVVAVATMGVVAIVACWVPARRASRTDPLLLMRTP